MYLYYIPRAQRCQQKFLFGETTKKETLLIEKACLRRDNAFSHTRYFWFSPQYPSFHGYTAAPQGRHAAYSGTPLRLTADLGAVTYFHIRLAAPLAFVRRKSAPLSAAWKLDYEPCQNDTFGKAPLTGPRAGELIRISGYA